MNTQSHTKSKPSIEHPAVKTKTSRRERRRGKSATAFRTISEVATELGVQQHVLRFWETKFVQIKPMKRGGGRRYYRPEDVDLLQCIHNLLYEEGYTIKGVQKLLGSMRGKKLIQKTSEMAAADASSAVETALTEPEKAPQPTSAQVQQADMDAQVRAAKAKYKHAMIEMLKDLKEMRALMNV